MPFEIVRNNIVNMHVDVIVNTANPRPVIGSGVDTAIHEKAGEKLLEARKQIGDIPVGEAYLMPAFNLNAQYVIHTVGPVWHGGMADEVKLLRNCYINSLNLAAENNCESIAFPLISTGNYGFPKDLALQTAIGAISSFLLNHEMQIYLVVFDKKAYALSEKLFKAVESYIDDHYVEEVHLQEYRSNIPLGRREYQDRNGPRAEFLDCSEIIFEEEAEYSVAPRPMSISSKAKHAPKMGQDDLMPLTQNVEPSKTDEKKKEIPLPKFLKPKRKLEDLLKEVEDTFSESLLRWIMKKDKTNPEVYKKANMDRKLFSKILNNKDYKPSKLNALALAIALELNLDEAKDFIGRAGYALTHSSKFDIIIEWFILQGNYDVFEINEVLFAFDQPLIGG